MKLQFSLSDYDLCIYYRRNVIMGVYVDDCLVVAPTETETLKVYEDLKAEFEVTNEGPIEAYLGVNIT